MMRFLVISCLLTTCLASPQFVSFGRTATAPQASMHQRFGVHRPVSRFNSLRVAPASLRVAPTSLRVAPASFRVAPISGDFVAETRRQAEATKAVLASLPSLPGAQQYLDRVLDSSSCLSSLEEAIAAIDVGVLLVTTSEPEIKTLVTQIKSIESQKTTSGLVSTTADVMDTLGLLMPKLTSPANDGALCSSKTSTRTQLQDLRQLALLLDEVAGVPGGQARASTLRESGRIIYAVTSFLSKTDATFSGLSASCNRHKDSSNKAFLALADNTEDLADLFGTLGSPTEAEQIRSKAGFVRKVVEVLEPLDGLSFFAVDCREQSFAGLATSLRSVAAALEDKGIQEISKELGIEFDLSVIGF